mgnify:CR=1 FL=1
MAEFTEYFENFWYKYGKEESLTAAEKGPKRKAYDSWVKVSKQWATAEKVTEEPEKQFAQQVWRGYEAILINRWLLHKQGKFCPRLPMVSTWLNQWRFEIETDVPSGDLRRDGHENGDSQVSHHHKCEWPDCQDKPIGRSYNGGWICRKHDLEEWGNNNRDAFRKRLAQFPKRSEESWREWSLRYLYHNNLGSELLKKLQRRNPGFGET